MREVVHDAILRLVKGDKNVSDELL